jgi:tetratricopeptide (TPR) repeat protein
VVEYEAAYRQAEELGSRRHKVALALSLGIINTKQGNYTTAENHLRDSIAMAREYALRRALVYAPSSLADLYLRQGEAERAAPLLAEAESLALEIPAKDQLAEIYRSRALVRLAGQDLRAALEDAERSVKWAQELGMDPEVGISLRVQGQVLLASGQDEAAFAAFEQSLGILDGQDPYEAARTKLKWGAALLSRAKMDRGATLLGEAQDAFRVLGASYESTRTETLLAKQIQA